MKDVIFSVSDDGKAFYILTAEGDKTTHINTNGRIKCDSFWEHIHSFGIKMPCEYNAKFDEALNLWKFEYSEDINVRKPSIGKFPSKPRKRIPKEIDI